MKIAICGDRILVMGITEQILAEGHEGGLNRLEPDADVSHLPFEERQTNEFFYSELLDSISDVEKLSVGNMFMYDKDENGNVLIARGHRNLSDPKQYGEQESAEFFRVSEKDLKEILSLYHAGTAERFTDFGSSSGIVWYDEATDIFYDNWGLELSHNCAQLKKIFGADAANYGKGKSGKMRFNRDVC